MKSCSWTCQYPISSFILFCFPSCWIDLPNLFWLLLTLRVLVVLFVMLLDSLVHNTPSSSGRQAVCAIKYVMRTFKRACMQVHKITNFPNHITNVVQFMLFSSSCFGGTVVTKSFQRCDINLLNVIRMLVKLFVRPSRIRVVAIHNLNHINIHRKHARNIGSSLCAATIVEKSP